ncbi:juvenile hormone esterase-like [Euwallacea fornicatus]|uniref:juvenile hormone esterase-like n=1 Tax=Euwallacea fornicatus TaxID=995702 RepID=UPI00338F3E48
MEKGFILRCLKSLILVMFQVVGECLTETVEITIPDGTILGQVDITSRHNVTYYNFKGIPFGQPPVGDLRFAAPLPNSPWNGTLDATTERSQCVQFSSDDLLGLGDISGDEDCLYINVYTPDYNATDLPVLVWIYGGAFINGNGNYTSFKPDFFLEQDIVYVSFNYRLGVLGFLSTDDEASSGNWGIKDQLLALKWVQHNIAYFGGNPKKVTIFGESAGSVSVHLLIQTTLAEGLFHRAIMCSGSTLNLWSLNTRAIQITNSIAATLDISKDNTTELVKRLRSVPLETLVKTSWVNGWELFFMDGLRGLPFAPTLEPNVAGAIYVSPSDEVLTSGHYNSVPVLMGFNSQEAVAAGSIPFYLDLYLLTYDINKALLAPWSLTQNSIDRILAGKNIKNKYFQNTAIATHRQQLINFVSADQFNRPIRKAAVSMAKYAPVYFYEFGYQGNVSSSGDRTYEGTGHAEDVDYYFKSANSYSTTDVKVSETIVLLWSNFVKYGEPTPVNDPRLNYTIWTPIDPDASDVAYLSLNESIGMQVNPKQDDWDYYQTIWDKYGDNELLTTY